MKIFGDKVCLRCGNGVMENQGIDLGNRVTELAYYCKACGFTWWHFIKEGSWGYGVLEYFIEVPNGCLLVAGSEKL